MTFRTGILALFCVVFIGAATFFNDMVMKGTYLIGNFLPLIVFGGLILFVILLNPLLGKIRRGLALSGRELGLVTALALFACYAPGRGLMHYFTTFLMMPHHHERTSPGWQAGSVQVESADVHNWGALLETIREGGASPFERTAIGSVRTRMSEETLARTAAGGTGTLDTAMQRGVLEALNGAIADASIAREVSFDDMAAPNHVRRRAGALAGGASPVSSADASILARDALDAVFRESLTPRRAGVLEVVPPRMLADVSGPRAADALDGFVTGLSQGDKRIRFGDIPWEAWTRTMMFWVPLLLTVAVASAGLALVLHRQWYSHEHLPYPTVEFARTLLPGPNGEQSGVFSNRLFWVGMAAVFGIHMINYIHVWWPEYLIPIQTRLDLTPLAEIFPVYKRAVWMFHPTIYFTAIGFAYFLASDVSLSLGLAPYLYHLVVGTLAGYGITVRYGHLRPSSGLFLFAGAYTGFFVVLLHSGRQYFRSVFARGLGLPARDRVENHAVWGARVFMIGFASFVAQSVAVGLEWPLAILYTAGLFMILTVMSRLLAEAGTFFLHAYCMPCAVLWGFMGSMALGREQVLIMGMLSTLLLIDPREAFMPFAVSAVRLTDAVKGRLGRTTVYGVAGAAIAMAVAVPIALYWQYQEGAVKTGDGWTLNGVPRFAINLNVEATRSMAAQGNLGASEAVSGLARFAHLSTNREVVLSFAITFGLVLLFSFLRHRFARWPLHPLIFLMLANWQSETLGFSFLLGWAIKAVVTKYGGAGRYQKLKPLMVGVVAGEVFAGMVPLIVGAIYYWVMGKPPRSFRIMPT